MTPASARLCSVAAALLTALVVAAGPSPAIEIISISPTGQLGNGPSFTPRPSGDGRFVVFPSEASNLIAGDTNATSDVFIRDRLLRATERVSVAAGGEQANDGSGGGVLSADGRFVAFSSLATDLVPGGSSGVGDVFVRDRLLAITERVSVAFDGAQTNAGSGVTGISADGRFVAFISRASNIVTDDTNYAYDVFVRDRVLETTQRVSVSSAGEQGDDDSGLYYASAEDSALSADGRFVAFVSTATNLVPGDTNARADIFVHDRDTGETARVSVSSAGEQAKGSSYDCAISGDGRYVAFRSSLTSGCALYLRDRVSGETLLVDPRACFEMQTAPAISADGRYVAYNYYWTSFKYEYISIAIYDVQQRRIVRDKIGENKGDQALSADGRWLAYCSIQQNGNVFITDLAGDGVPPETQVVEGPCGQVLCSSNSTAISWSGSDPPVEGKSGPVAFAWRLDGGPWSAWTTDTSVTLTGLSDGAHVFEVKARDLSGNEDPTPARCEFTVDYTPPVVSITSPANGATARGTVTITAAVSGVSSVERVEFYVNGELLCTDTEAPYSCEWDTTSVGRAFPRPPSATAALGRAALQQNGPAQICAKAFDVCARSTQKCITVTVRNQTFEDVPPDHPAWLAIETIAARGITSGCLPAQQPGRLPLFCPYANITRAQLAAFICRAAGKTPLERAVPTFADVPKAHWAYGYIERFCDAESWGGNAPGYACSVFPSKRFCPGTAVTREQIAWILCTATGKPPMPSCSGIFADVPSSNPFCRWIERLADATSWPGSAPVTSGCLCPSGYPPGAKCYCPKSPVTRAQMAVFLVKAFGIAS